MPARPPPGRCRLCIRRVGTRLSDLVGVDCSLGCCLVSVYTFCVWFGCFAFILWGCYCDDPAHGYANDWNRVYHPKDGLEDDGYYVHRCAVHFAAALGLEWCVAVGGIVAVNVYLSLPVLGFIVWYYGWRLAGKSLALGFSAAAGLVAILFLAVDGADPPPGFGISGVPLGGCIVAGCTSLLLHVLASGYGYRKNEQLGHFLGRTAAFATLSVAGGVAVSFLLHVALGLLVPLVLLAAAGLATQAPLLLALLALLLALTSPGTSPASPD